VVRWLDERVAQLRESDPSLDPIADVVAPPPDLAASAELPVDDGDRGIRPLGEISALVGRLRVKPHGRIYCARSRSGKSHSEK
jgi:hypothetical protein